MSFADAFSQCLSDAGIPVDSGAVPESSELAAGLGQLSDWIGSLTGEMQQVLDEVTGDYPVSELIAEADIAPSLAPLLRAIDALEASVPISTFLSACESARAQVGEGDPA